MFNFFRKKEKTVEEHRFEKFSKLKLVSDDVLLKSLEPECDFFVKVLATTEILRRMNEKERLLP